ncbi:MAG: hypothetical protein WA188_02615, partial [Terriglobales bacterium]
LRRLCQPPSGIAAWAQRFADEPIRERLALRPGCHYAARSETAPTGHHRAWGSAYDSEAICRPAQGGSAPASASG